MKNEPSHTDFDVYVTTISNVDPVELTSQIVGYNTIDLGDGTTMQEPIYGANPTYLKPDMTALAGTEDAMRCVGFPI